MFDDDHPRGTPVMQIIADDGELYYLNGSATEDAFAAFGEGCTIQHGTFVPTTQEN